MSEEKKPDKTWSVFAVCKSESMDKFAEDLEKKLNKLNDDGYQMAFMRWLNDDSVVVGGRTQQPLSTLLGMMPLNLPGREPEPGIDFKGRSSQQLFSVAFDNLDTKAEEQEQTDLAKVIVEQVMGRAPAEELQNSLNDCELAIEKHECSSKKDGVSDDDINDCHITKTLRVLKKALSDRLQLQLQ